jgi:hypothetical protein
MPTELSRSARLTTGKLVQDRPTRAIAQRPEGDVQLFVLKHSHVTI